MQSEYDLAIIGAGPTGLAAAIYTTREDIKTIVYDRDIIAGGWIALTGRVENYPGFPDGIDGPDLAERFADQAGRFGAKINLGDEISAINRANNLIKVSAKSGEQLVKAVLVTSGTDYRRLGVQGEQEYLGKGVHYCAVCDGPLYRDKQIVVAGGGNSAMQEGLFLTKFANITMLVRGRQLKGSRALINQVTSNPKIKILYDHNIQKITGTKMVESVLVQTPDGDKSIKTDAIFVFIGQVPNTKWLDADLRLDSHGFIVTNDHFETNLHGLFAAGDVRSGATFQIGSAVGEGVSAAYSIRDYLAAHQ